MQPKHPRIQMELDILREVGFEVGLHCNTANIKGNYGSIWNKLRYYFTFTYFHWPLIDTYSKEISQYDAVILYDFAFLPLLKRARKMGKYVVYETIDNNVTYTFHALTKRLPFMKMFEGWVTGRMKRMEIEYSRDYAHHVIVNSPALKEYIGTKNIIMNLYASPFEAIQLESRPEMPLAYLYLGEFTEDKGGTLMLDIVEETKRPFIIYGNVKESSLKNRISGMKQVVQKDRMNVSDLMAQLKEQSKQYKFAGFSLIKPVHLSFATQEANKDIDYMALGIPIVGNERGITKEKVDAGCGVMYNDAPAMVRLDSDAAFFEAVSGKCKEYYAEYYSRAAFTKGLMAALETTS